jgi:hypothetical protein
MDSASEFHSEAQDVMITTAIDLIGGCRRLGMKFQGCIIETTLKAWSGRPSSESGRWP